MQLLYYFSIWIPLYVSYVSVNERNSSEVDQGLNEARAPFKSTNTFSKQHSFLFPSTQSIQWMAFFPAQLTIYQITIEISSVELIEERIHRKIEVASNSRMQVHYWGKRLSNKYWFRCPDRKTFFIERIWNSRRADSFRIYRILYYRIFKRIIGSWFGEEGISDNDRLSVWRIKLNDSSFPQIGDDIHDIPCQLYSWLIIYSVAHSMARWWLIYNSMARLFMVAYLFSSSRNVDMF